MLNYTELEAKYTRITKKTARLIDIITNNYKTMPSTWIDKCEQTVKEAADVLTLIETEVTRRSKLN